ncbi:nitrogenase cofactor biosynthesis protein NifB [Halocella sp. SP3-1]|uniref:nitrogenase cofactor biosynthesis protein NifB n=1 Tax=Halocella sp. SP3-1 TaxID=2382161 RepID=UPI000F7543C1|nr:nitrogenase cofactor biosynthesis protein NifB [Halocella sp. SP3-1]AZO94201.1 nitrogenase cofactor biosynthesis protein NifB [Halocella sp. SP3-1]
MFLDRAVKTKKHPCFSKSAHNYARMHIPVAPVCNISCNYCNRKYDCVNESRPGVTSEVLSPEEALAKFRIVKEKMPELSVVGVAGPGDSLANFPETKKSIQLIQAESPDMVFCLSTNGLMLPEYQEDILQLGISHLTITINAVNPRIGAKIYAQVNYQGVSLSGEEGATLLLDRQLKGLEYLSARGIVCKVNILLLKGINDSHLEEVVQVVKKHGAYMTNIMPLIPVKGTRFEDLPLSDGKELNNFRKKCSVHLKQMYHCQQCRSDAVGCLGRDRSLEFISDNYIKEREVSSI